MSQCTGSSACISEGVRNSVRNACGNICWLCTARYGDVVHVFPNAEGEAFRQYQELGLINAHSINEEENLIFLCPSCHCYSDGIFPGWVFLPADFDELIQLEEQFHAHRAREASAGRLAIRSPPPVRARLYVRYVLRPTLFPRSLALFDEDSTAFWGGDPASTILRNAGAPFLPHGNQELIAILPKLTRLLELYQMPPPPIVPPSSPGGNGDDQGEQEIRALGDTLEERLRKRAVTSNYDSGTTSPAPKKPRTSSPSSSSKASPHSSTRRANSHHLSHRPTRSSPHQNGNHPHSDQWVFGPERTSAEVSETWRQYEEVRKDAEARAEATRRRRR